MVILVYYRYHVSLKNTPYLNLGQRQSQSPESVAPNVRVSNPIGQSQSRVNISTGCRETMNGRQRVSNKESATPESYQAI